MYPIFNSIADAKKKYKRVRSIKHFILSEDGVNKENPTCTHCGKPVKEDIAEQGFNGNRCQYFPRTKKVAVMHYICAWNNVLNHIFENERLI